MVKPIADLEQRHRALQPEHSFIVQAPAGSGKTELLSQRYLTLLARVEAPEEILAITFTRKAAAEMRSRILAALRRGCDESEPDAAHERLTWELSRAVLARDAAQDWQLLEQPGRLRIQTIDALCASLTRQMPLLSRFGRLPGVSEQADELHREAARRTLELLEAGEAEWSPAVERLLDHLDNDQAKVEGMLATMLAGRDQWLRHVAAGDDRLQRVVLEQGLCELADEALKQLERCWPPGVLQELAVLAAQAAANLHADGERDGALACCLDQMAPPVMERNELPRWLAFAHLLLTDKGEWRKRLDKKLGFPPPSSCKDKTEKARLTALKSRMQQLLGGLLGEERLRGALAALRELPPSSYHDEQWRLLQALFQLLPLAVAQLRLVFQERGEVDFTEIAQAALSALGEPEAPTDLALALDYRISHILVDEFQDTSLSQYELLERLTAGWQPDDGRTLFAVGDPMQSIYRFRDAQVGLYLRARREGIGSLTLEPLTLSANFRSQGGIVDWVNAAFSRVLPVEESIALGAVAYSPSQPVHEALAGEAVTLHPLLGRDDGYEAAEVARVIAEARAANPEGSVAVLVRGRSHLAAIVPALHAAGLRFRAVEIEHLGHRPLVQDLTALTRALLHTGDRTAWLALLRAPWCGLRLDSLHTLVADAPQRPVWALVSEIARRERLAADERRRLERILPTLERALQPVAAGSLRDRIEACWLALGGPACVAQENDLKDAHAFFALLEGMERAGGLTRIDELEQRLARLFAAADSGADESLQIMTIHKSKGLEFDTVLLPALGRKPANDSHRLLIWSELPRAGEQSRLLLAPVSTPGEGDDPIYRYLRQLEKEKGRLEDGRLLYVAATRARQRLHLFAHCELSEKGGERVLRKPYGGSLLEPLWPVVAPAFEARLAEPEAAEADVAMPMPVVQREVALTRLSLDWQPPAFGPPAEAEEPEPLRFEPESERLRRIGTVIHLLLQRMAEAPEVWGPEKLQGMDEGIRYLLRREGVAETELATALQRCHEALSVVKTDPRGQWLLSPEHREAQCEYAISSFQGGYPQEGVIDRTFIDSEGVRWIIDYKSSVEGDEGREAFLDAQRERYRPQLERYAAMMALVEERPIRLGIYFPLSGAWCEWAYGGE